MVKLQMYFKGEKSTFLTYIYSAFHSHVPFQNISVSNKAELSIIGSILLIHELRG